MIWSREPDIARTLQIRDVIVGLLHKQVLLTNAGRKLYAKKIHETDYFMTEPHFAGLNLQFRFGWSTV
jgi:hypothetical protein